MGSIGVTDGNGTFHAYDDAEEVAAPTKAIVTGTDHDGLSWANVRDDIDRAEGALDKLFGKGDASSSSSQSSMPSWVPWAVGGLALAWFLKR